MRQSESIGKLLNAMVLAQAEFTTLPKDKSGYGYKYTDLDTVISTVKPILSAHGLGFMQSLSTLDSGARGLTTRLFCKDGEWLEDTIALPDVAMAKTNAAQNLGAAITYMKRYALCAILGISSDEDTDAVVERKDNGYQMSQEAQRERNKWQQSRPQPKSAPKSELAGGESTETEKKLIKGLLNTTDNTGHPIFSTEEKKTYCEMRKSKTAKEVIDILTKESSRRVKVATDIDKSFSGIEEAPKDLF